VPRLRLLAAHAPPGHLILESSTSRKGAVRIDNVTLAVEHTAPLRAIAAGQVVTVEAHGGVGETRVVLRTKQGSLLTWNAVSPAF
jgi:hypothetical protein